MNRESWILFCTIFHMENFLQSLTKEELKFFKEEMYILLDKFQQSGGNDFQRDVAMEKLEHMLQQIPGSISDFTNYIQPHTKLRAAILRLGEMYWSNTSFS